MSPALEGRPKKPYKAPKLVVYGDLTNMTQVSGMMGHADNPGMAMGKTGP